MTASGSGENFPWHTLALQAVYSRLKTDSDGLSSDEATTRQSEYGPNRLPQKEPTPAWLIFLRQFRSPLIYILGLAAVISIAIGETTDAGFIALVLVVNSIIGGTQEFQAERSSRALQGLLRTRGTAVRDGDTVDIDGEDFVPGDVVLLESGDRVPADIRLISTSNLEVDESSLTGESVPILKDPDWRGEENAPLGDRRNMAFAGTTVTRGRGRGLVVETGARTVIGRLAGDVSAVEGGAPPLVVRMERFTRIVAVVVLLAAVVAALLGVFVRGFGAVEMFLFAVALAVSAIPEGLPVAMTVALGVATSRMVRIGVIVRQLVAVEGLGSCTMIATDKTGTLTENELTVRQLRLPDGTTVEVTGAGYAPDGTVLQDGSQPEPEVADDIARLARAAALCNEGSIHRRDGEWVWSGDPTDVALLSFARKAGRDRESELDALPETSQVPFEPDRRFAATYHSAGGETRVFTKGAPERVLEMCTWSDEHTHRAMLDRATEMAQQGYRVLALADGTLDTAEAAPSDPTGLTFLGFVGMVDPLRPGVRDAVASAQQAGISVSMVTGDHPETALSIARELGLASGRGEVLTGAQLAEFTPEQFATAIERTRVFARVSPDQKLDIVSAAQQAGHFVAVTGDGVNDAPALRIANIGIAMGQDGTDVARDAADLIISDDNFATIMSGIEQGRVAYDNIRKVIYLLISTGAAEVVLVLLSLAAGLPLPLLPVQLLWLNLVTNGIQDVALAFEPKEDDVLARPPRSPDERIFNRLMIERTVVASIVMGVTGLLTFRWLLDSGMAESAARNALLLLMVLFESVHLGNTRSETRSIFRMPPWKSPILLVGAGTAFLVHLSALYFPPAQLVLGTAPVDLDVWVTLAGIALTLVAAMELHKVSWRWRHPARSDGD
ncbi:HAD-IC family P-type ATPase [Haloarcula sp. 1CSR25-25]|uniref:cation-translocating P-type ATPase n=1 Tax=Haloarcula sp. 1CSR25-25 TaxID=2862545 RepID=UPI002895358B|nr:HAD-IC family P-type ATPase [Haloarcula sp. 1CSR25-25]MDT3436042.1 HAD-IC family P-type ATPase [Haloarcula sp. 1CSR25-25]